MLGAIEAGGTKFVCGIGDADGSREQVVIATRDVATTMAEVGAFFARAIDRHGAIHAFGVGSFGPLDLDPISPAFGRITTTPKPGWRDADIPAWLNDRFGLPVAIDTDVNAAALAEARLHGVAHLAYVTIGTGIGVGLVTAGATQNGFGHPEAGHIPIRRQDGAGAFAGICPFHGDCLEGVASGPAIKAAWGGSLAELPAEHPAWAVEAAYLGQLCAALILMHAPERIVLGGGVMQQAALFPLIRAATLETLGGYCAHWDAPAAEERIVPPRCTEPSGLTGAYLLASDIDRRSRASRQIEDRIA